MYLQKITKSCISPRRDSNPRSSSSTIQFEKHDELDRSTTAADKRERKLIKSGFGLGLDLTGGIAWQDGYLTHPTLRHGTLSAAPVIHGFQGGPSSTSVQIQEYYEWRKNTWSNTRLFISMCSNVRTFFSENFFIVNFFLHFRNKQQYQSFSVWGYALTGWVSGQEKLVL